MSSYAVVFQLNLIKQKPVDNTFLQTNLAFINSAESIIKIICCILGCDKDILNALHTNLNENWKDHRFRWSSHACVLLVSFRVELYWRLNFKFLLRTLLEHLITRDKD